MKKKILFFLLILLIPLKIEAITKLPVDVTTMSIKELQSSRKKGYFTYEELVKIYIERIEKYNQKYNAIISVNENAINEAKKLDIEYKKSGKRSMIFGLPIILKDNIDFKNLPTTNGTKSLSDSYPKENAEVTKKLINAGAIIIAKANMSEFAFEASSSRSSYGHVLNAYNTNYTPYGSSGGSAVGVAASLAVASIGTDTNSSIRTPASANNVVGMRPTFNLVSTKGVINYDSERDTVGPITKYVSDNAIILNIINKENKKYLTKNKYDLSKYKVGILKNFMNEESDSYIDPLKSTYSEIVSLMNNSVNILKSSNLKVIEIDGFYNEYYNNLVQNSYSGTMLCYDFNKYIKNTNSKIKSYSELIEDKRYTQNLKEYLENCNINYKKTKEYKNKVKNKKEYKDYVLKIMKKYELDALIYPTTKNELIKIEDVYNKNLLTNSYIIAPTTGFPSINIPIGFDKNDLPYGMEILSKSNNEEIIYEIAYEYEKNTNYYKLPKIAKNLYEYTDENEKLINNYETLTSKKYDNIKLKTKKFLNNYNNEKDNSKKLKELNNEYEQTRKTLFHISFGIEDERKEIILKRFIKYGIILFTILYLLLLLRSKIKNRRKRKKIYRLVKKIAFISIIILVIYLSYEFIF